MSAIFAVVEHAAGCREEAGAGADGIACACAGYVSGASLEDLEEEQSDAGLLDALRDQRVGVVLDSGGAGETRRFTFWRLA